MLCMIQSWETMRETECSMTKQRQVRSGGRRRGFTVASAEFLFGPVRAGFSGLLADALRRKIFVLIVGNFAGLSSRTGANLMCYDVRKTIILWLTDIEDFSAALRRETARVALHGGRRGNFQVRDLPIREQPRGGSLCDAGVTGHTARFASRDARSAIGVAKFHNDLQLDSAQENTLRDGRKTNLTRCS